MSLKIVTTARGNMAIQHKGFNYRKDRTLATGDVSWRCVSRKCTASLKTSDNFKILKSKSGVHNHPPTSTNASPQPSPSTTLSPAEPDRGDPKQTPSCDTPTLTPPNPSLTELLSPYTTITPAPPEYNCPESENRCLRQRVAELEYITDALRNKSIELEQKILAKSYNTPTTPDTQPSRPKTPPQTIHDSKEDHKGILEKPQNETLTIKQPCNKCLIYQEETKNMIQSIRSLEEEIKILKQITITTHPPKIQPTISNKFILPLNNSFEILSTTPELDNSKFNTVINKKHKGKGKKTLTSKYKTNTKTNINKTRIPFRNVTVVGDSHCRGLAALMASGTTNTDIKGICKPGAGLLNIASTSSPPDDHAYVIIAGTNDVAAGREEIVFQHMEEIIKQCRTSSKVLVSPLPPRHDLPPADPVHMSVALVNNFISELCCRHEGVEVLDLSDLGRRHFTRHGLHLNAAGKKLMAGLIVNELARVSATPRHRRPAKTAVTVPPSVPPPPPSARRFETYLDAVVNGLSPRSPVQPTPLLDRRTVTGPRGSKPTTHFLGNPLANDEIN